MKFKLSVITVSFNAELSIEKTIKNVIRNKNKDIEYIVIDGGSKDKTLQILSGYRKFIDILISEKDNGMYDALNKGIKNASGQYVMLLAADDQLIDGALQTALGEIREDTDVYAGAIIQKTGYGYFYEKSDPNLEQLKVHCSLKNPASIFRREAFDKFGYYSTEYKCSGDRELFLRFYLNKARFQVSDTPLVVFKMGGMSTNLSDKAIPESERLMIEYGLYSDETEQYYEKMTKHEKLKMKFLNKQIGRMIIQIGYSPVFYPLICLIKKRENNRLSKMDRKKYNLDC